MTGKSFGVKFFDCVCVSDNCGDGFAAESGFVLGENGLIGSIGNHAEAIFAGDILGGKCGVNSGMRGHEGIEIAEAESGAMEGAANHAQDERIGRGFIGAVDFGAVHFAGAIHADDPVADDAFSICLCSDALSILIG